MFSIILFTLVIVAVVQEGTSMPTNKVDTAQKEESHGLQSNAIDDYSHINKQEVYVESKQIIPPQISTTGQKTAVETATIKQDHIVEISTEKQIITAVETSTYHVEKESQHNHSKIDSHEDHSKIDSHEDHSKNKSDEHHSKNGSDEDHSEKESEEGDEEDGDYAESDVDDGIKTSCIATLCVG